MRRLDGRRIAVTGAASGIGRATVLRLLADGATVWGTDIAEEDLRGTLELAGDSAERLTTAVLDVSDERSVETSFGVALARFGGLDALVNAAGILSTGHTATLPLAEWQRVITVNLTGTFLATRAALPALLESRGAIVNFSSTSANFGHAYMAAYAASKGGIEALTHSLAVEYGKHGLRAVALQPGSIDTGITRRIGRDFPQDIDASLLSKMQPLLRYGEGMVGPEAVAGVISMLVSDDGRFISGTEIRIDGATHA